MEPASLGAIRQYQIAKRAITPDQRSGGGGMSAPKPDVPFSSFAPTAPTNVNKTNPLAETVQDFAQVFENVETTTKAMGTGQADAHSVVEALATAEVALETAVTIRNRVVEAYQELLRMPI